MIVQFIFIILFYQCWVSSCLQCLNENNEEVDWFMAYKIPKMNHNDKFISKGLGFVYLTSKNYSSWTLSQHSINDSDSLISTNLAPFYNNKANISFIFYNDQPPNGPSKQEKGHTKGVILADNNGGLWLIHSVPHFPQLTQKYEFSPTGMLKGQSFICISLDLKTLNNVGIQLKYNEPQIFAGHILKILENKLPELVDVLSGNVVTQPPWYNKILLISKNGISFFSFAKSKKFAKDLYEDWVAPDLQEDLFVESWLNGAGRLPSNCSKIFKVYNVQNVKINVANVSFLDSQDHSKWAVSQKIMWLCIGDLNRMEHQKFRGGGTLCINNTKIAQNYWDAVKSIEHCATTHN